MSGRRVAHIATEHRDGIPWHEKPIPFAFHRCKAQTWEVIGIIRVETCACGATRSTDVRFNFSTTWGNKNCRQAGTALKEINA